LTKEVIKLKVAAAMPKDQGRSIVRLSSDIRNRLGVRSGDFV